MARSYGTADDIRGAEMVNASPHVADWSRTILVDANNLHVREAERDVEANRDGRDNIFELCWLVSISYTYNLQSSPARNVHRCSTPSSLHSTSDLPRQGSNCLPKLSNGWKKWRGMRWRRRDLRRFRRRMFQVPLRSMEGCYSKTGNRGRRWWLRKWRRRFRRYVSVSSVVSLTDRWLIRSGHRA